MNLLPQQIAKKLTPGVRQAILGMTDIWAPASTRTFNSNGAQFGYHTFTVNKVPGVPPLIEKDRIPDGTKGRYRAVWKLTPAGMAVRWALRNRLP